jgi:hypothetical protein
LIHFYTRVFTINMFIDKHGQQLPEERNYVVEKVKL